uniref:Uncharacterized protein n=1 Tax=Parascaris univalens TaxID=6257 RepID=A0A915AIN3_PARUN
MLEVIILNLMRILIFTNKVSLSLEIYFSLFVFHFFFSVPYLGFIAVFYAYGRLNFSFSMAFSVMKPQMRYELEIFLLLFHFPTIEIVSSFFCLFMLCYQRKVFLSFGISSSCEECPVLFDAKVTLVMPRLCPTDEHHYPFFPPRPLPCYSLRSYYF